MNHKLLKEFNDVLNLHLEGAAILTTPVLRGIREQVQEAQTIEVQKQTRLRSDLRDSLEMAKKLEELEDKITDELVDQCEAVDEAHREEASGWERFHGNLISYIRSVTRSNAA